MVENAKAEQPATQPAADEPPVARIITTKERERTIPLDFPVEFNGVTYEGIRIRRISGKEFSEYVERLENRLGNPMPPVVDCPLEVWDAMDADDQAAVEDASMDFMPRRLKAAVEQFQADGESTQAS